MEWSNYYSGKSDERAISLVQTADEGFALGGFTHWPNGYNSFIVKTYQNIENKSNLWPVADAGSEKNVYVGENISFNGTGYDSDGNIVDIKIISNNEILFPTEKDMVYSMELSLKGTK